jgi:hypothetical protein
MRGEWSGFKLFFFRHVGDMAWRGWSSVFQDSVKNMTPRSWVKSPNSFCNFLATTIKQLSRHSSRKASKERNTQIQRSCVSPFWKAAPGGEGSQWYCSIGKGSFAADWPDEAIAAAFDQVHEGILKAISNGLFSFFLKQDDINTEKDYAVLTVLEDISDADVIYTDVLSKKM